MLKKTIIVILILSTITHGFSLECTKNMQGLTGTCISKTYTAKYTGETIYWACNNQVGSTWWYYETCTATVSNLGTITDEGEYLANDWSNNADYVSACNGRDGWLCNVNAFFGFQANTALNYVGYCDSSESNCVKCDGNVESLKYNGGLSISGTGDGECEVGCGAPNPCDEISPTSWSNNPNASGSPFEAYCSNTCSMSDTRCREDFGAHSYCDYKDPGEVCNSDYCDANNRLVDFNGNAVNDTVSCEANCGCDDTVDTLLCDSLCSAHASCHRESIGFNNGNAGCNNVCDWLECGLYAWNTPSDTCFITCDNSSQCFNPAVCDLVGSGVNECVVDVEAPVVSELTPVNDSRFNANTTGFSFSVSDNADAGLDCSYSLNGANVSVGVVNSGEEFSDSFILTSENWYEIFYFCTDESGNTGYSDSLFFLFDQSVPEYSNFNFEDVTWTVDDTLIDGDVIRVYADWTDNFQLGYSELLSDISGPGWTIEDTIYHNNTSANESSFYFNTTGLGGQTVRFRIRTYDTAGNNQATGPIDVTVLNENNSISVALRESGGNYSDRLEFLGDAQAAFNVQAFDSGSSALLGDFLIEHIGLGTTINNSFSLNSALPAGIQMKVSGTSDPSSAVYLSTTASDNFPFCQAMVPGEQCEVWLWMDLVEAVPPQLEVNNIVVESETV